MRLGSAVTDSMTFGRRIGFGANIPRATQANRDQAYAPGTIPREAIACLPPTPSPSVDDEIRAWKLERRRGRAFRLPWQQLLLVGSLSFFIASFVLPASINSFVDWVLDLCSAASLFAWLAARRKSSGDTSEQGSDLREVP